MGTETYLDVSSCPTCAGHHALPPPSDGMRIYFEERNGRILCKHLHFRRQAGVEQVVLARKDQTPDLQTLWDEDPPEDE